MQGFKSRGVQNIIQISLITHMQLKNVENV
jgi:hypothetical protein